MLNRLEFLSLWAINDALRLEELTRQLDDLKAAGMTGVVFHPRFYPNQPDYMGTEYLATVSELILYAKKIEMTFWIYDENGWPSGTAGGEVLARLPDSRCHWVEWKLNSEDEGEIAFGSKTAVSSFDRRATEQFISFTHEGYRKGLASAAFDYVTGFFSDEVAFLDGHGITVKTGALPWDEQFPLIYEQKHGEALLPVLPLLFNDGEGHPRVRVRYWEMLTDAITENFYEPISAWCEAYGKRFTAHLKGEENPYFQLSYSGSCFQVLKGIETPAIDALERFPGNHFYPRIAHSVAVQQGRQGCLVEAMGGGGWGVSPETFENYVLWLAGHGIHQFVFHLNQLKLKSEAIRDWPPSMPSHMSWRDAFPALLASLQKKAALLPDLRKTPEVLIITPTRGIMASFLPQGAMQMNEHNGTSMPDDASAHLSRALLELVDACHALGLHYELSEERVVEEDGVLEGGKLRIGQREYDCMLLADGCLWRDQEQENKLRAAGVKLLYTDTWQEAFSVSRAEGKADGRSVIRPEQSSWKIVPPELNQLLLELQRNEDGSLSAEIRLEMPEKPANVDEQEGLSLLLHDPVQEIWVNGHCISEWGSASPGDQPFRVAIPVSFVSIQQTVVFKIVPLGSGEQNPIVFIQGQFAVLSWTPFTDKDERQVVTESPFVIAPERFSLVQGTDFVAAGYPFAALPVRASKKIRLVKTAAEGSYLQLANVQADAARIFLDGKELGWCWGTAWRLLLPAALSIGSYELELILYPSTYNGYGPHRHRDGDRHLISPDQFKGVRNFADHPSAPALTLGEQWHFVRWGIEGDILLVEAKHDGA
ncbi:hypothetical protein [Paenibacillus paridis]|uniref:hypothetical protein n=1 Tax=Paenibacillus paridis TaxID=2583376 RepID=UPI001122924C|nr:hypothetical protein [Paenibacillus paridis]